MIQAPDGLENGMQHHPYKPYIQFVIKAAPIKQRGKLQLHKAPNLRTTMLVNSIGYINPNIFCLALHKPSFAKDLFTTRGSISR
jgi:hypothetical protein